MNYIIKGYEPAAMFRYFEDISAIPRSSGNESGIADYIVEFAKQHGLYFYRDTHHNVLIRRPASKGYEERPAVLLQGHTDMVCEKNNATVHDFTGDGLKLYIKGEYLHARGTTLGADDGVAVALMLAILDDEKLFSPVLECLFTSEEETGLTGADNFDYTQITAVSMINLDGETEGEAWASCAGGIHSEIKYRFEEIPFRNKKIRIRLSGLAGGHSGSDIDKNRANAIKLMGRILMNLYEYEPFNLISLNGGSKLNAIPRECEAQLSVLESQKSMEFLLNFEKTIFAEVSEADKAFGIRIDKTRPSEHMMTYKSTSDVISLISLSPNGVLTMSSAISSLVESSANPGMITTDNDCIHLAFMNRSSNESVMDDICLRFDWLAKMTGSEIRHSSRYPGWNFDKNSKLQKIYLDTYRRLFGEKRNPRISAVHAGLECGVIKKKAGDIDIIALGPEINHIHTPDEELNLKSFERFWVLITEILRNL